MPVATRGATDRARRRSWHYVEHPVRAQGRRRGQIARRSGWVVRNAGSYVDTSEALRGGARHIAQPT